MTTIEETHKMEKCEDHPQFSMLEKILKDQVIEEGYDPTWIKLLSVYTQNGDTSETGQLLCISVFNPIKREWSKGSMRYAPRWCDTKYNFQPLGNIYSVFDWMCDESGATFKKNNPDCTK
jgi:hypothetical protein